MFAVSRRPLVLDLQRHNVVLQWVTKDTPLPVLWSSPTCISDSEKVLKNCGAASDPVMPTASCCVVKTSAWLWRPFRWPSNPLGIFQFTKRERYDHVCMCRRGTRRVLHRKALSRRPDVMRYFQLVERRDPVAFPATEILAQRFTAETTFLCRPSPRPSRFPSTVASVTSTYWHSTCAG